MPVEHQAVTSGISRVDQLAGLELAQDALGNLPWRLLELDERGGVEAARWAMPRNDDEGLYRLALAPLSLTS